MLSWPVIAFGCSPVVFVIACSSIVRASISLLVCLLGLSASAAGVAGRSGASALADSERATHTHEHTRKDTRTHAQPQQQPSVALSSLAVADSRVPLSQPAGLSLCLCLRLYVGVCPVIVVLGAALASARLAVLLCPSRNHQSFWKCSWPFFCAYLCFFFLCSMINLMFLSPVCAAPSTSATASSLSSPSTNPPAAAVSAVGALSGEREGPTRTHTDKHAHAHTQSHAHSHPLSSRSSVGGLAAGVLLHSQGSLLCVALCACSFWAVIFVLRPCLPCLFLAFLLDLIGFAFTCAGHNLASSPMLILFQFTRVFVLPSERCFVSHSFTVCCAQVLLLPRVVVVAASARYNARRRTHTTNAKTDRHRERHAHAMTHGLSRTPLSPLAMRRCRLALLMCLPRVLRRQVRFCVALVFSPVVGRNFCFVILFSASLLFCLIVCLCCDSVVVCVLCP